MTTTGMILKDGITIIRRNTAVVVRNIIIYNCDKCGKEFRESAIYFEDKHFCTEKCLREYLYNSNYELLWNKCHKITKFENNYYIDDTWKIISAFKVHEKDRNEIKNIREECLVLCCESEGGFGNGVLTVLHLRTYNNDFDKERPRKTDIYSNGIEYRDYKYSLIAEPERSMEYFEKFLKDTLDNSDYISDRLDEREMKMVKELEK